MIKVLFIAENLSYGGAQKMLTFVANNLDRSKYSVALLNENSGAGIARPLNEDIEYYEHAKFTRKGVKRFEELSEIIKIARKVKPDVIVSFLTVPNFLSSVAGRRLNIPVIVSERGDPSRITGKLGRFFLWYERKTDGAVFQTEGAKAAYPKQLQKKATVIPNPVVPVSVSRPFEYKKSLRSIAMVGRLENAQKRYDIAVKAISVLRKRNIDVTLNLYGSGYDDKLICEIAENESVSEETVLHGKVTQPLEKLLENDIFLLTSDYEGIPNALIEAMSLGMPCVSTDCSPGGAAMLIQNGENGLLVNAGDVEGVADAIERFINDAELARSCGEKAKVINEIYAPEKIIGMWNDYIEKVVEGNNERK